jgi:hypothetical protein
MAHGGIADATPKHMFKFAHGGGVMGFDEGGKADAIEAINKAMPEDSEQKQAALKAVLENFAPSRQETYAERDTKMHEQPNIYADYKDPNSISNLVQGAKDMGSKFINALPKESGIRKISNWIEAGRPGPSMSLYDYLQQPSKANAPELQPTAVRPAANVPNPSTGTVSQLPGTMGAYVPRRPPAEPAANLPAGLPSALPKPAPTGDPMKIAQGLAASLTNTTPAATTTAAPAAESDYEKVAKSYLKTPSEEELIKRELARAKAFGYDTPAGQDAMRRADLMEKQIEEWNQGHNMSKLQALLTGIQTGGYGGGAPAANANEQAYRENVIKNWELINSIKSPIEQARRAEAIGMGKNVVENKAKADELAQRTATSLLGEEMRNKSAKEVEQMRAASSMAVQQLASATQIKIHQMAQAAADAHRELTPQELEVALRTDPKYKDMSYADRLGAAYGLKTGRSEKMGVAELSGIIKAAGPLAMTDENAKAQFDWATGELQKLYQNQNYQPGSAPTLQQFLAKAGPLNPKMTQDQLTAKYSELYGKK